jgi:predicted nucleic acid-binding protein
MRVLIDSNVLISAARSDKGTPYAAFLRATMPPNQAIVCSENLVEMRRIFNKKFPHMLPAMERFLAFAMQVIEVVPTPSQEIPDEQKIPDVDDRPILRAAARAGADVVLTGDGDFLDSGIEHPKPMKCADFLKLFQM